MTEIKPIIDIYEQITKLIINAQNQLSSTLQIVNSLELINNLEIVKTYFMTIFDFLEKIEELKENPECVHFIQKYKFYWLLDKTDIYIKTLEPKNQSDLEMNIIEGFILKNSNNINKNILVSSYNFCTNSFELEPTISWNEPFIHSDETISSYSSKNIHGDTIFYCYFTFETIKLFLSCKNSYNMEYLSIFYQTIGTIIEFIKKYMNTLVQYHDIYLIQKSK